MTQWLRLANSTKRVIKDIGKQPLNALTDARIGAAPISKVFLRL